MIPRTAATIGALAATLVGGATGVSASPAAAARPQTTVPGVVYEVAVTLTPTRTTVARDKLTRNGQPRYPRGAIIRYAVRNTTGKTLMFEVWGARTRPIKPGHRDTILVNWNYRGKFRYRAVFQGHTLGTGGYVTIF
jgi:hypothetical protein